MEGIVTAMYHKSVQLQAYVSLPTFPPILCYPSPPPFFLSRVPLLLAHLFLLSCYHLTFLTIPNRPNGIKFTVPPENIHVPTKLRVGDVVTFSYDNPTRRNILVNPKIYRLRSDVDLAASSGTSPSPSSPFLYL